MVIVAYLCNPLLILNLNVYNTLRGVKPGSAASPSYLTNVPDFTTTFFFVCFNVAVFPSADQFIRFIIVHI